MVLNLSATNDIIFIGQYLYTKIHTYIHTNTHTHINTHTQDSDVEIDELVGKMKELQKDNFSSLATNSTFRCCCCCGCCVASCHECCCSQDYEEVFVDDNEVVCCCNVNCKKSTEQKINTLDDHLVCNNVDDVAQQLATCNHQQHDHHTKQQPSHGVKKQIKKKKKRKTRRDSGEDDDWKSGVGGVWGFVGVGDDREDDLYIDPNFKAAKHPQCKFHFTVSCCYFIYYFSFYCYIIVVF